MEKLTMQEEQAMQAIWVLNGGFVKEILDQINDASLPYTTLASTIRNLEKKKYVLAKKYANAKRYEPIITADEYKKSSIKTLVGDYFKNSYKEMVTFFVKEENLSSKEWNEIVDIIKNNKS